jgi:hypothetical protein
VNPWLGSEVPNTAKTPTEVKRPTSMKELGFEPQLPVRWFDPRVLAGAGLKVVLSSVLGDYLDKRELQETAPGVIIEEFGDRDHVWIDFVADTGDGFDATYTVAWSVSQDSLTVNNSTLPRGELLVFGGDEVYPTASAEAYENRCIGPYRAALPWTSNPSPVVVAVPGNHDWYDGLTSFIRAFTQHRWIGGRRSIQDRSYFAIRLPHGHWLWGVDIQSGAYLDSAQIAYFKKAAGAMSAGDRLILCTAAPVWIERHPSGQARNLAFVERELVPPDVEVILTLTGDEHHYARYGDPVARGLSGVKVTAGGGGAFLSPTHNLPTRVSVPVKGGDTSESLDVQCLYPNAKTSRRLSLKALSIGFLNSTFPLVTGLVGWFIFAANTVGLRTRNPGPLEAVSRKWSVVDLFTGDFRSPQTAVTFALLFAAMFAFAIPRETGHSKRRVLARALMAVVHTVLHLAAAALVSWVVLRAATVFGHGTTYQLGAAALMAGASAVVGSLMVGVYLAGFGWFGRHDNESFSAFRHEGYKNFLRMRVSAEGVEVHALGIERVVRNWRLDPESGANPGASWFGPPGGVAPNVHLIDRFHLPRDQRTLR